MEDSSVNNDSIYTATGVAPIKAEFRCAGGGSVDATRPVCLDPGFRSWFAPFVSFDVTKEGFEPPSASSSSSSVDPSPNSNSDARADQAASSHKVPRTASAEAGDQLGTTTTTTTAEEVDGAADEEATADGSVDGNDARENQKKRGRFSATERAKNAIKVKHDSCVHFLRTGKCRLGDGCRFSHDVASWMTTRPADLGPSCYFFSTYETCPYGLMCRFAGAHAVHSLYMIQARSGKSFADLIEQYSTGSADERSALAGLAAERWLELADRAERMVQNKSCMRHETQTALRKRKYNFDKAKNVVKLVEKFINQTWTETGRIVGSESSTAESNESNESNESPKPTTADDGSVSSTANANPSTEISTSTTTATATATTTTSTESAAIVSAPPPATTTSESAVPDGSSSVVSVSPISTSVPVPVPSKTTNIAPGDVDKVRLRVPERRKIDFRGKLYLAPLTTVGNLPFRRLCKELGADITCGEMAMSMNILQGNMQEWALMKRHPTEDCFGVQLCGKFPDQLANVVQLIEQEFGENDIHFIDLNVGCPIDLVFNRGLGSALLDRPRRLETIIRSMTNSTAIPITMKLRTAIDPNKPLALDLVKHAQTWGLSAITVHGRTRKARYRNLADWDYIAECARASTHVPLIGNGDILSYADYEAHQTHTNSGSVMVARGALVKPWVFSECKERRLWDISATERLDMIRKYTNYGLDYWGSDDQGIATTRRFLLEFLSWQRRYIPVGLLEVLPSKINDRPPPFKGRSELETLLGSPFAEDWMKISEMFLGPTPAGYHFVPKHKSNAWESGGPITTEG